MYLFRNRKEEKTPMFMIAGLGNPTSKYEKTRHNVGFDVIEVLSKKYNIKVTEKKFRALCGTGSIEGKPVLLLKPQTFMNLSGESIQAALKFYRIDPAAQLLVVYDDISLPPGKLRIRKKGSAGGHNGIKNILAQTGTQEFLRIKVGVGEKPPEWDLADYVLSRFSKAEQQLVGQAVEDAAEAAVMLLAQDVEKVMNLYN